MELPQPRPYRAEDTKATHDFLSLHPHPSLQHHQNSRPSQEPSEISATFTSLKTGTSSLASYSLFGQKEHGFLEMMKSARELSEDEDDYIKKEVVSSPQGDIAIKIAMDGNNQKVNTSRSKHSATEQRRRSKINERFQILRNLIPHTDQKRDKASFLLEVIEYIRYLQEKVHETDFPGWDPNGLKPATWSHNYGPGESLTDHSHAMKNATRPRFMISGKLDGNYVATNHSMLGNSYDQVEAENMNIGASYKPSYHKPAFATKTASAPISFQQHSHNFVGRDGGDVQPRPKMLLDSQNMASESHQNFQPRAYPNDDDLNEQKEFSIEGGRLHLSTLYSQRLLNSLRQTLQSSGINLSQASISVHIDLSKRTEEPSPCNQTVVCSRSAISDEDLDSACKRFKKDMK